MSSRQFVVIEIMDNKVVRMIKWTRNTDGDLEYKITKPQPIKRITNPRTVSKFWETISVPHQFYDLKEKRFYTIPSIMYAESEK
jgi:hypothetical protein